jgi:hypothetical protein
MLKKIHTGRRYWCGERGESGRAEDGGRRTEDGGRKAADGTRRVPATQYDIVVSKSE